MSARSDKTSSHRLPLSHASMPSLKLLSSGFILAAIISLSRDAACSHCSPSLHAEIAVPNSSNLKETPASRIVMNSASVRCHSCSASALSSSGKLEVRVANVSFDSSGLPPCPPGVSARSLSKQAMSRLEVWSPNKLRTLPSASMGVLARASWLHLVFQSNPCGLACLALRGRSAAETFVNAPCSLTQASQSFHVGSLFKVRAFPTTMSPRRARVIATLRRRLSATKPNPHPSFDRTVLNTITSFSLPWYASTDLISSAPAANSFSWFVWFVLSTFSSILSSARNSLLSETDVAYPKAENRSLSSRTCPM
mmetsp:Transcript_152989/g.281586  ORF Transcript_152989/g.281586 Transcript_152989/m.281586 type:complete len:310 (-) Transcript_152989:305-1234(-)